MTANVILYDCKNNRKFDIGFGLIAKHFADKIIDICTFNSELRVIGYKILLEEMPSTLSYDAKNYFHELTRRIWKFCELATWSVIATADEGPDGSQGWPSIDTFKVMDKNYGGIDKL